MDTDEYFHVMFAYDGEHPPHEAVHGGLPAGYSAEHTVVEHGDVGGTFVSVSDGGPPGISDLFRFVLDVQQTHLAEHPRYEPSQRERLEQFFDIVREVYLAAEPRPAYVYGLQHNMEEGMRMIDAPPPADGDSLAEDRVNYAVWLTVFPPRLVETYGRDRLLSAPVWRVEELADGAILLVYDDEPFRLASFDDLNEHLGLDDPGL